MRHILLAMMLSCLVIEVNAGLLRYDFNSNILATYADLDGSGVFEGFVEFDESLVPSGGGIVDANDFSDWGFNWGDVYTYGPATHTFDQGPTGLIGLPGVSSMGRGFAVDASLNVIEPTFLCFGQAPLGDFICDQDLNQYKEYRPIANIWWDGNIHATSDRAYYDSGVSGRGWWSQPIYITEVPSQVPEPSTLWLLVPGLLGLIGISRRKKAA